MVVVEAGAGPGPATGAVGPLRVLVLLLGCVAPECGAAGRGAGCARCTPRLLRGRCGRSSSRCTSGQGCSPGAGASAGGGCGGGAPWPEAVLRGRRGHLGGAGARKVTAPRAGRGCGGGRRALRTSRSCGPARGRRSGPAQAVSRESVLEGGGKWGGVQTVSGSARGRPWGPSGTDGRAGFCRPGGGNGGAQGRLGGAAHPGGRGSRLCCSPLRCWPGPQPCLRAAQGSCPSSLAPRRLREREPHRSGEARGRSRTCQQAGRGPQLPPPLAEDRGQCGEARSASSRCRWKSRPSSSVPVSLSSSGGLPVVAARNSLA